MLCRRSYAKDFGKAEKRKAAHRKTRDSADPVESPAEKEASLAGPVQACAFAWRDPLGSMARCKAVGRVCLCRAYP